MELLELLAFLVVLWLTSRWVLAPIRSDDDAALDDTELAVLEAERDARLAAVRDARLDLDGGKLSADDHRALDARLRAEALDALRVLDAARSGRTERR